MGCLGSSALSNCGEQFAVSLHYCLSEDNCQELLGAFEKNLVLVVENDERKCSFFHWLTNA